jgi:hypothetical protein
MSVQQMSKRVVTSNDDVTELSVEESEAPIDTNFILSLLGFKSPLVSLSLWPFLLANTIVFGSL